MKNETNKNTVIAVLIVIIIILSILVILFATDTISFNSRVTDNNNELFNENIDKEDTTISDSATTNNNSTQNKEESNNNSDSTKITSDYIGEWYLYENADYLKIINIDNNQIKFDWFIYRIDMYKNVVATIASSNIATFKSTDDLGTHEIEGKLTFEENLIKLEVTKVTDPKTTSIEEGYTITFDKKK